MRARSTMPPPLTERRTHPRARLRALGWILKIIRSTRRPAGLAAPRRWLRGSLQTPWREIRGTSGSLVRRPAGVPPARRGRPVWGRWHRPSRRRRRRRLRRRARVTSPRARGGPGETRRPRPEPGRWPLRSRRWLACRLRPPHLARRRLCLGRPSRSCSRGLSTVRGAGTRRASIGTISATTSGTGSKPFPDVVARLRPVATRGLRAACARISSSCPRLWSWARTTSPWGRGPCPRTLRSA